MHLVLKRSLILLACIAISACGPIKIDSVPPGLALESVSIETSGIELNLLIENRNDSAILVTYAELSLELEGTPIINAQGTVNLDISPRGRESLSITLPPEPGGEQALQRIDRSARYQLMGRLEFQSLDRHEIEVRGFLHPVPGQPGRYR
ncbi:MAG: hypothetical protein AAGH65_03400 [Pseudomonadota bacterium]